MRTPRTILHVDLDAFFASCELLRRPELTGLPLAVGGGRESRPGEARRPGRGVVAASSYEARHYGVHSAMPLARALELCPELVVLPVDIGEYARVSRLVFEIFARYTPVIEPGSLDEAFLDLTAGAGLQPPGAAVARELSSAISSELGLPCSVGVASNKTVAKIASDLRKPRGLVVVPAGGEAAFLAPLPLARLPGAGPRTTERLHLLGISTLGQLAQAPRSLLVGSLGPGAEALQRRARGEDSSPVTVPGRPRSISREETYDRDISSREEIVGRLRLLSAAVGARLRRSGLTAGGVALKVRFDTFETVTRARRLAEPACSDQELAAAALQLLDRAWDGQRAVRLLGVGAEGLSEVRQLGLFDLPEVRRERLDQALDSVRRRFGLGSIGRGPGALEAPTDWNRDHLPGPPSRPPDPAAERRRP